MPRFIYILFILPWQKDLFVRTKLVLRLIWAFLFATFAAIFSQLIPPVFGEASFIIRVLLTLAAAGIGYVVFPPVASSIRVITQTSVKEPKYQWN